MPAIPPRHGPDDVARDGTLDEEGQDSQATVLDLHHAAQGCKAQPFATQHTHASLRRSRGTVAQLPDIACAMSASLQAKQGPGGCRGARNSAVAAGVGRPGVNCHSLSLSLAGLVLGTAMPTRDWPGPPRTTYRGVVNENRSSASIFEIHVDTVAPMFPAGSHADRVFVWLFGKLTQRQTRNRSTNLFCLLAQMTSLQRPLPPPPVSPARSVWVLAALQSSNIEESLPYSHGA